MSFSSDSILNLELNTSELNEKYKKINDLEKIISQKN